MFFDEKGFSPINEKNSGLSGSLSHKRTFSMLNFCVFKLTGQNMLFWLCRCFDRKHTSTDMMFHVA